MSGYDREEEEKNIVEMTIRVDLSRGISLDHICAKCGKTEKSLPLSFDSHDRATGKNTDVFTIRSSTVPEGWEDFRGFGRRTEICPDCIRKFLDSK